MARREPTANDVKQLPLRLDHELYQELSRRSTIEEKSMSDIVRDALRAYFDAVRITKPQLRAAIERIAHEDAEILEALERGPQENTNGVPDRQTDAANRVMKKRRAALRELA
jgi:hypothetical protein